MKYKLKYKLCDVLKNIMPECDVNFATYYLTAFPVIESKKGKPFYLIQHNETKTLSEIAEQTYHMPLNKICVSKWIQKEIENITNGNVECKHIPNGIDNKIFCKTKTVCAIFNGIEWKGEQDIIDAMNLVNETKKVKLIAVGNMKAFDKLIQSKKCNFEIIKHNKPNDVMLNDIYNTCDVFVCASWYEGFGLPPLEAMSCGTRCVITRCGGVDDFAKDKYNCLMCDIKSPEQIAEKILLYFDENYDYSEIEKNAEQTAKEFGWDKSVEKMNESIKIFESLKNLGKMML